MCYFFWLEDMVDLLEEVFDVSFVYMLVIWFVYCKIDVDVIILMFIILVLVVFMLMLFSWLVFCCRWVFVDDEIIRLFEKLRLLSC